MDNTSYISLSNQVALHRELDIVAHNIANMNTTAFKTSQPVFEKFLVKPDPFQQKNKYHFVSDIGMYRNLKSGELMKTSSPLDIGITGSGFLKVQNLNNNEIYFTRNGRMSINENGILVDTSGNAVLDDANGNISINDDINIINIAKDGTISTQEGVISKIGLFNVPNPNKMELLGNHLLTTDQESEQSDNPNINQGFLENSNVNPIEQINKMILLQRSYEATQRMVDQEHKRKTGFIQRMNQL